MHLCASITDNNIITIRRDMKFDDILGTIGRTPVVRLNRITSGMKSEVYVKVEGKNPGGSIKDRAALSMIDDAVTKGNGCQIDQINERVTLIEFLALQHPTNQRL